MGVLGGTLSECYFLWGACSGHRSFHSPYPVIHMASLYRLDLDASILIFLNTFASSLLIFISNSIDSAIFFCYICGKQFTVYSMLMKILNILATIALILSICGLPLFMIASSIEMKAIIMYVGGFSFVFWLEVGIINTSKKYKKHV